MTTVRPDLLEAILAATRARVAAAEARCPRGQLEREALLCPAGGAAFVQALSRRDRVNLIAECKRRSPSRGVLRAAYDPVAIAGAYERAGAAAISVLTEPGFFDGNLDHLRGARAEVAVPLLRKDFILDEYQLLEARLAGADAVLLIVAALDDGQLVRLLAAARQLGLAALVEVHGVEECDRALAAGAHIIGVNNRNLRTLEVDLAQSEAVASRLPSGVIAISESGLTTPAELHSMMSLGYHAFLIGERLMTARDPGGALASLLASLDAERPRPRP